MPDVNPIGSSEGSLESLESYLSPFLTESFVSPVAAPLSSHLNLGSGTISSLFDIGDAYGGKTMRQLMEEYPDMKMFIIATLLIAKAEECSTENLVQSINMYRKSQEAIRKEVINQKSIAQEKREKLAYEDDDWKALAGTSPSGSPTEEKKKTWWQRIWHLVVAIIIAMTPIAGFILAILNLIAMIPSEKTAAQRKLKEFLSDVNLGSATADLVAGIYCEATGKDENSEEVQKLKIGIMIAVAAIQLIQQIIAAIVMFFIPGGQAFAVMQIAKIVLAIAEIAAAAANLAANILQVVEGYKELKIAEERYILNRLIAATQKLRLDLETISQNIDIVVEMFSSKLEDVREEYEKASRILKEYNDAKLAVIRNFRA